MPEQIRQALEGSAHQPPLDASAETAYQRIFRCNREWVEHTKERDPDYFARNAESQHPTFLFIGCSDSRVPAELLTGAQAGEIFVHRNVANLALPADLNVLSVLQYAVDALQVKTILVCGHYGCGGVRAALNPNPNGFVDHWLGGVRDVVRLHAEELGRLEDGPNGPRERRLVELNAAEQARRLRRSPVVQAAWARGQALSIHAMVYDVADGLIHDLGASAAGASEEDALRDAHDSEWLREFERRTQAAKGRPTPAVAQSAG
jgi:carbonic anhydrase